MAIEIHIICVTKTGKNISIREFRCHKLKSDIKVVYKIINYEIYTPIKYSRHNKFKNVKFNFFCKLNRILKFRIAGLVITISFVSFHNFICVYRFI